MTLTEIQKKALFLAIYEAGGGGILIERLRALGLTEDQVDDFWAELSTDKDENDWENGVLEG